MAQILVLLNFVFKEITELNNKRVALERRNAVLERVLAEYSRKIKEVVVY